MTVDKEFSFVNGFSLSISILKSSLATLNTSRTFYFTYLHKVNIWSYIWRSRTLHPLIFLFHRRNPKNVLSSCFDLFKSTDASYLLLIILSAAEYYSFLQRSRNTFWFIQATIKMGKMSTWMTLWTCYWDIHQVGVFVFILQFYFNYL